MNEMFSLYPDVSRWKIEFTATTSSLNGGLAEGSSSLVIEINQLPKNGTCTIFPMNGIAAVTNFTINCSNWVDEDGRIMRYEFFGIFKTYNFF